MKKESKIVMGELFDIENKNLLETVSVHITQEISGVLDDQPHRSAQATIKGFKPQLADKDYILKISEIISGKISLSTQVNLNSIDYDKTEFTVNFNDDVWNKSVWFELL